MSKEEYRPQPSKPTERHKPHQEGGNGAPGIQPTPERSAHEGRQSPSGQPAVFGNCIVRDLMPSSERVDEMLAVGHITEGQATQLKKEALAIERTIWIADRIQGIRRMLIDRGLSTTEKRPLRAEYKSLRKEVRRLRKELWES
jgi:polyhydroxyalkanoate synthesis regulator phasin